MKKTLREINPKLELDNLVRRKITNLYRVLSERRAESQLEYANVYSNYTQVPSALGNMWEMRYRDIEP
jgi:hypothetical protein